MQDASWTAANRLDNKRPMQADVSAATSAQIVVLEKEHSQLGRRICDTL
jgi:hypothetical protein